MKRLPDGIIGNAPGPLGAHFDGRGAHFSLFSESAERVDLCLFDASGQIELRRLPLPDCTDGVWHGYVPGASPGLLYGYRVAGPYAPLRGQRFNAHKLLVDPYARRLSGSLRWNDALYGYVVGAPEADLSFDERDSAPFVPKAVLMHDDFDWGHDRAPQTPWADTVIYEAHLRGLTQSHPGIPYQQRGYAAALAAPAMIEHLQRLGVTAIELLPIHAYIDDRFLVDRRRSNYWGYNTLGFFAPELRYLAGGTLSELKAAIKALHAAGIEVLLDVVYNHTCEGSEVGPTLSFRGIDNAAYYRLHPEALNRTDDFTGCGNSLNFSHRRVVQMALDSMRYWVSEFHVDGFRLDLGVTLGRESHGFDPGAGFFDALLQDPVLSRVKLITEPWDLGLGGYQLGNHPPGMAEWNDRYRDDVRRFWRGHGNHGTLAARLQGSAEVFDRNGRRPWSSINFVCAHDGFTLADWSSYERKHNEANGEDNRDGTDNNESANWGVEGPTSDPQVNAVRAAVRRAMLATLLFSHGTPMLLGGDEFSRTQLGNNNAYCQDSPLSWFDWGLAHSAEGREQTAYVARLTRLRQELRSLRAGSYQHGRISFLPGLRDVDWFDVDGQPMQPEGWHRGGGGVLQVRRAVRLDDYRVEVTLLLINNGEGAVNCQLPAPTLEWVRRLDSRDAMPAGGPVRESTISVAARSVQLLSTQVQAPAASSS